MSKLERFLLREGPKILMSLFLLFTNCKKDPETIIPDKLESGITLTFDDSHYDDWIKILPTLNKYNANATFFVTFNYSGMGNKEKILTLYNAGNEIGSHTINHPSLSAYLKNHTLIEYYANEILPQVQLLNSLGIEVTSFAYPYGEHTSESDIFLGQYFNKIRLTSNSGKISQRGKKILDAVSIDNSNYRSMILDAKKDLSIIIFFGHIPVQTKIDSICQFVQQNNMKFYRICDIE